MKSVLRRMVCLLLTIAMITGALPNLLPGITMMEDAQAEVVGLMSGDVSQAKYKFTIPTDTGIGQRLAELRTTLNGRFLTTDGKNHPCKGGACSYCNLGSTLSKNSFFKQLGWTGGGDFWTCASGARFIYKYLYNAWCPGSNDIKTSARKTGAYAEAGGGVTSGKALSATAIKNVLSKASMGDLIYWEYTGTYKDEKGKYHNAPHWLIYLGYKGDTFYYIDTNGNGGGVNSFNYNRSKTFANAASNGYYSLKNIYILHAANYNKVNADVLDMAMNISAGQDGTIKFNAYLDRKAFVGKWTLGISDTMDGLVNGTSGVNRELIQYQINNQNKYPNTGSAPAYNDVTYQKESKTTTVKTYLGNPLEPGKTYYYRGYVRLGNTWFYTKVRTITIPSDYPLASTLSLNGTGSHIGLGDSLGLSWTGAGAGCTYEILVSKEDGSQVGLPLDGGTATSCGIPGAYFTDAGNYIISMEAANRLGKTHAANTLKVTVHPNVTVTFEDSLTGEIIGQQSVAYGRDAVLPAEPARTGYRFTGWRGDYKKISQDTSIYADYEGVYYTVKFYDSITGKLLSSKNVCHGGSALAPSVTAPKGYVFVGWDVDINNVTDNLTAKTVYRWYDNDYPVMTEEDQSRILPSVSKNGYDVKLSLFNGSDNVQEGRAVIALKSADGTLLTNTESSAFSLKAEETKQLNVFVPYGGLAAKAEIYVINSYSQGGPLAAPITLTIDNSSKWSEWIEYTDPSQLPVAGSNGILEVETDVQATQTLYSYRDKDVVTSTETSKEGYVQDGSSWIKDGAEQNYYYASFPSSFYTSNALYTKYAGSKKSSTETATAKTEYSAASKYAYIYWHWCRGTYTTGPINRGISYTKTSTYNKFHAFQSTTAKSYSSSGDAYQYANASACADSYWWCGAKSGTAGLVTVYKQTYQKYKKQYQYYRWSDWSEYSTEVVNATDTREVRTLPGETRKVYRYKTMELNSIEEKDKEIHTLSGKVDPSLAGKTATVYVHKYSQISDYTTEFTGTVKVGDEGSILIPDVRMREELSAETGDYTITASVAGNTGTMDLGKIYAPLPEYTVTFYDYDGKNVISQQTLHAGETAKTPDISLLHLEEGYRFTRWNQSTVNVHADLNVLPEKEKQTYVVVFVDWANQTVTMEDYSYGDAIVVPMVDNLMEGKELEWDLSDATCVQEAMEDGETLESYIVTHNTIVEARYKDALVTASFVDPDAIKPGESLFEESILPEDILATEVVTYGQTAELPEVDMLTINSWRNVATGQDIETNQITESGTYYPVYSYTYMTEAPWADVESGAYEEAQSVTLSSETEGAAIYYTTDGSDPKSSDTVKTYTKPITVKSSTALQYYAAAPKMEDSEVSITLLAIHSETSNPHYMVTICQTMEQGEGNVEPVQTLVKANTPVNSIEGPVVEGYTFTGYYLDEDLTKEFTGNITSDMVIYPGYQAIPVMAVFKDEGGKTLKTVYVSYGEYAEPPAGPEKAGYRFVGWDKDTYQALKDNQTFRPVYVPEENLISLKLTRTKATVLIDSMYNLKKKLEITPAGAEADLTWTSSDGTVAVVDENGLVTMVGLGTATVTVKEENSRSSTSCTFQVVEELEESHSHTYVTSLVKATLLKDGSLTRTCQCGSSEKEVILHPGKIQLGKTTYVYDGAVKKPSVTVKDSEGNPIAATNYTVTYQTGRKNVGKYTVKIAFKGNYTGSKSLSFTIKPVKTSISALTAGKKAFTVKWAKKTTQVTGYELQYSTSSTFASGNKTVTVTSAKTVSKTIKSLKAKKKYHVRIRTYKTVSGTKYYSDWSPAKSVTTKQ